MSGRPVLGDIAPSGAMAPIPKLGTTTLEEWAVNPEDRNCIILKRMRPATDQADTLA